MSGHIVVEAPNAELQTVPKPEGRELPALPQIFGGSMWGGASEGMVGTMPPPARPISWNILSKAKGTAQTVALCNDPLTPCVKICCLS